MADIQLFCPDCGKTHAVSEYIEKRSITCSACGQTISMPELKAASTDAGLKQRKELRLSKPMPRMEEPRSETGAPVLPTAAERISSGTARDMRRVRTSKRKTWLSGLIFIVLAGTLAYIRFYADLPEISPEKLKLYGILALAACYLLAIVIALRDNMFDGLLAIFLPLYPFYYLFFSCSNLYMRALVGALLAAFGYDLLLFLQAKGIAMSDGVNRWIVQQ